MNITQQIQRYEHEPGHAHGKDRPRPEREVQARNGRREPAEQIARVPEEEGERDEARRLEDPRRGVGGAHADDLLREDGEEHGDGEGQKDGARQVAELLEQGPQAHDFARGVLWRLGASVGRCGVQVSVRVPPQQQHKGQERGDGDGGRGQEVCKGGSPALLGHRRAGASVVVFWRRDREDGHDLRYAGQHARDGLSRHDGLRVLAHAEAGDVGEDAVLAEAGGETGGEDDGHEEAKVHGRRDAAEQDGGEGEEGEADGVEDEGEDDAVRVVGAPLELGQEEHGGEVRDRGDGDEGGGKGGEEGVRGAEAVLEIGRGGEEHVPACCGQTGWGSRSGKVGELTMPIAWRLRAAEIWSIRAMRSVACAPLGARYCRNHREEARRRVTAAA